MVLETKPLLRNYDQGSVLCFGTALNLFAGRIEDWFPDAAGQAAPMGDMTAARSRIRCAVARAIRVRRREWTG